MSFISSSSISAFFLSSGLGLVVLSKTPSWLLAAKTLTDMLASVSFHSDQILCLLFVSFHSDQIHKLFGWLGFGFYLDRLFGGAVGDLHMTATRALRLGNP